MTCSSQSEQKNLYIKDSFTYRLKSRKLSEFEHLQSLKPEFMLYMSTTATVCTQQEKRKCRKDCLETGEREITDSVSLKI